jgi:hypothetical protein
MLLYENTAYLNGSSLIICGKVQCGIRFIFYLDTGIPSYPEAGWSTYQTL